MKKLTPFGKALRKLRIDQGETQMDVARALGVSVAFLSAVETGRKAAPTDMIEALINHFGLDEESANDLRHQAWVSRKEVKINMQELNKEDRDLVAGFARKFEERAFNSDQLASLRKLLGMEDD